MCVCMYVQYELLVASDVQFRSQTAKEEAALLKKQAESAFGEVATYPNHTLPYSRYYALINALWSSSGQRRRSAFSARSMRPTTCTQGRAMVAAIAYLLYVWPSGNAR